MTMSKNEKTRTNHDVDQRGRSAWSSTCFLASECWWLNNFWQWWLSCKGIIVFLKLKTVFLRSGWPSGEVGVSPLDPDHKQMWKLLPYFSIEIWFLDTQNTLYFILRVLKNAISCPLCLWIGDSCNWVKMTFLLCKIRIKTHIIIV